MADFSSLRSLNFDRAARRRLSGLLAIVAAVLLVWQIFGGRAATPAQPSREVASKATEPPPALPAFDAARLQDVRDLTLGVRQEESSALLALLDYVRRVPVDTFAAAARDDVLHANLMHDPDQFRGEPIVFTGTLRRCSVVTARSVDRRRLRLCEAWVFTGESGRHPYRILTADLPQEWLTAEALDVPVRVAGCFLKRDGYDSPQGLQVAPLIVANSLSPLHTGGPLTVRVAPSTSFGVVMALGLIATVTLISFAWGDRRPAIEYPEFRELSAKAAQAVRIDRRSLRDVLRELSERDRLGSWPGPQSAMRQSA